MAKLFEPLKLGNTSFKNRIFVSPMCQYSAVDGVPQPWHMVHLGSFATGGAALVLTEATGVTAAGRISPGCTGLWNDRQVEAFKNIVDYIHSQDSLAGVQLAHAGRKASTDIPWRSRKALGPAEGGWQTIGPSAVAYDEGWLVPHEMTKEEIRQNILDFVAATERAERAGFDVVELHMAHGYLMHEFLSPLSNKRQDEYGGSLENRMRAPLELAAAVRKIWKKPLFVRISATDWVEGGWDLEQSVVLCEKLKALGIDFIDVSSGGLSPHQRIKAGPGYQVPFAEEIKKRTGLATGAVGLITKPDQAEAIVKEGKADAVLLAREFLRDPHWPLRAAHELGAEVKWPVQYDRARF